MKKNKLETPMEIFAAVLLTLFAASVVVGLLVGGFALGLGIITGLVFLLMNVLMPVVGVIYPLTVVQCFCVALIICVVRILLRGTFRVVVKSE